MVAGRKADAGRSAIGLRTRATSQKRDVGAQLMKTVPTQQSSECLELREGLVRS